MKLDKTKQSKNTIDITDPKVAKVYNKKNKMLVDAMESPRTLSNEPIAWNEDRSPLDNMKGAMANPGKTARKKPITKKLPEGSSDPDPQKLSKGPKRKNYENIPAFEFLKHTIKENK